MSDLGARTPVEGAVVIGRLSTATRARLERAAGAVAQVGEQPPMVLVDGAGSPRALCARLNELVGAEGYAAPVLADSDGNRLFPTGQIQVRFGQPVDEERLAALAARHGVELAERNRWAPQQVAFRVRAEDDRFLPDLAAAIGAEPGVEAAWPAAKAGFRRER